MNGPGRSRSPIPFRGLLSATLAYAYAEEFWPRWAFEPLAWLVDVLH